MCKYCENIPDGITLKGTVTFYSTYKSFNEYKGEWHDVKYSNELLTNKEIKFCPMCGKKLDNGGENNNGK